MQIPLVGVGQLASSLVHRVLSLAEWNSRAKVLKFLHVERVLSCHGILKASSSEDLDVLSDAAGTANSGLDTRLAGTG